MLAAIDGAQSYLDLEFYLVEAGQCADTLVQALERAARREVRVRCLFDGYGSLAFTAGLRLRLTEAGLSFGFITR